MENSPPIALASAVETTAPSTLNDLYNGLNDVDNDGDFDLADLNKIGFGYGKSIEEAGFVGDGIGMIDKSDMLLLGIDHSMDSEVNSTTTNSLIALATAMPDIFHPGDANSDGKVDIADLNAVGAKWYTYVTPYTQGDLNGDGYVDLADLNLIGNNWGYSAPNIDEVTGIAITGQSLTVSMDSTLGHEFEYEWRRDGLPIPGAIESTYVLTDEDAGHDITVEVATYASYPSIRYRSARRLSNPPVISLTKRLLRKFTWR